MSRFSLISFVSLLLLSLYGCSPKFKGATASVSPNPLEVHADSVKATVKATVPPKSGFAKGTTYAGDFVLQGGTDGKNNTYKLGSVRLNYADLPDVEKNGASRSMTVGSAYDKDMNGTKLKVVSSYERKGKSVKLPDYDMNAPCCITTSQLVSKGDADSSNAGGMGSRGMDRFKSFPSSYTGKTAIADDARFQFPKNVFLIQANQYSREDIKALGEFLKRRYEASSVSISGFASPEGSLRRNEFLSLNRSRQVQHWLMEQLKKDGYKEYLDSSFFKLSTTSEDWEGFKANLDKTNYSEDVKRQIIEIISAGYDEDEKEHKIMALVGGANRVESILSPLRRATIHMEAFKPAFHTDRQLDSVAMAAYGGNSANLMSFPVDTKDSTVKRVNSGLSLSQEEYLYSASRMSDSKGRAKLLADYAQAYGNDYRGFNNLGVAQAQAGMLNDAYTSLSTANRLKPNDPTIQGNMVRVQMMRGNFTEGTTDARSLYNSTKSPAAAYLLGYNEAKKANYKQAIQYFSDAAGETNAKYNSGLCKLLMNDLAGAKSDLDAAIRENGQRALNYYVQAIVGARSGDTNLMVTNLKQAVQLDKSLAKMAVNDLEFRQYVTSAEFKAATTVQ